MDAFDDTLHAIGDGGTGIGEIADKYPEHLLAGPVLHRESAQSASSDTAGGAVVGSVERYTG